LRIDSLGTGGGGEIVTNNATIVLNGPNANIVDTSGVNALSNLANNPGSFTVEGGQQFTASSTGFTNNGALRVGTSSGFTTGGTYTQTVGTTRVDGTLTSPLLSIIGGVLSGAGTVTGNLSIGPGGTLSPGDSPGTISISGDYSQLGTLDEEIGGASSPFDATNVGGKATIGGTLDVLLVNGFTPGTNADYSYIILTAANGVSGAFGTVDCPTGDTCRVDYNLDEVVLDVDGPSSTSGATPEPSFFLPLAGILAALAGLKIRSRRRVAGAAE
jgi:hypothetical protein